MGFPILSMTREKFKVCEKETKTKTYSKEGLARAAVLDPEEQAKEDMRSFLQASIDKLGVQIESCEADMERLSSGKGAKKNKVELEEKESFSSMYVRREDDEEEEEEVEG